MQQQVLTLVKNAHSVAVDDFHRANAQFGGLTEVELKKEYGQSGQTCEFLLNNYREEKERLQRCIDWVESQPVDEPDSYYVKHHSITETALGVAKLQLNKGRHISAEATINQCCVDLDELTRKYQPKTTKMQDTELVEEESELNMGDMNPLGSAGGFIRMNT